MTFEKHPVPWRKGYQISPREHLFGLAGNPRARLPGHSGDARYLVGKSPAMLEVFRLIEKLAQAPDTPVLIAGPTGVGKELVARGIHFHSERNHRPFIAQNCAAFHENLLESELFGHSRGAFTGAVRERPGIFEAADRGTLFLDEVSEMSPPLQAKLLRVLQEGVFLPVGCPIEKGIDVRVVAATNRDLLRLVEEGKFREDLYYRLNVVTVQIPSLAERAGDIPLLIEYFLSERRVAKRLSPEAEHYFLNYRWPGNVRELRNELERLLVLSGDEEQIPEALISAHIKTAVDENNARPFNGTLRAAIDVVERDVILRTLKRLSWNKSATAKELGISRSNLISKVHHYRFEDKSKQ